MYNMQSSLCQFSVVLYKNLTEFEHDNCDGDNDGDNKGDNDCNNDGNTDDKGI